MVTLDTLKQIEAARWNPHPETSGFLRWAIASLTEPESDGVSKLERVYLTCEYENQRNEEIQTAVFALIGKRFKEKVAFFQADCPAHGRCRFHLRLAKSHADLASTPPAHGEYFLNLLKDKSDWIIPAA